MTFSSDEDDDDLLAAIPAFSSRSTRESTRENRKLDKLSDYISSAFVKSESRKESRSRNFSTISDDKNIHVGTNENKNFESSVAVDWKKLDSMVDEADKIDALEQHKKKRILLDSIDGLDEEDSSFLDDEARGFDGSKTMQDRIALAGARVTALSSGLGVRRMLGFYKEHGRSSKNEYFFQSLDEALLYLKKQVRRHLKDEIKELIMKAEQEKAIPALLYRRNLVKSFQSNATLEPSSIFIQWLWKLCLSGSKVGFLCSDGARRTLKGIIALHADKCKCAFILDDFVPCLVRVYGYREQSYEDDVQGENDAEQLVDMLSLELFLDVWNTAFLNNAVTKKTKTNNFEDQVFPCLEALGRIGLDPRFHASEKSSPCRKE